MATSAPETPARGTRPRNRRAITLEVATDLFYRLGYAQVSMSDIADATNVGASALYRHFPSKADLLVATIHTGLERYVRVLAEARSTNGDPVASLEALIRKLVESSIDHRELGVLWQREARNLTVEEQRGPRDQLIEATADLSAFVLAARPDLDAARADVLAWCAMGAVVSVSFHSLSLPRPQFVDLLTDVLTTIVALPMPETEIADTEPTSVPTEPESRRDSLITVATELFADRGYAATGIDEIGDAAGIAGPSVYSHFASKQAILAAAIERASGLLRSDSDVILEPSAPASVMLGKLVDSYVHVANRDRFVIRTLVSEMDQLSPGDREAARRQQREYIDGWVQLLRQFTEVDEIPARVRVQAVLLVVNDAVQTPHLRSRPGFEHTLARMAKAILGVESV